MNGLTLRISGTNSKKMKGSLAFNPVVIPPLFILKLGSGDTMFQTFSQSDSVDEQLVILKDIINSCDEKILSFLVVIFLQTEIKHPVKCFVVRYISKNSYQQEPFSKALAQEILNHISSDNIDYKLYSNFVPKLATCIENFPPGAQAIKLVELKLVTYLTKCLQCCGKTLSKEKSLSPTEKNEIYNLIHLTLRLMLHIMQKIDKENVTHIISSFPSIWSDLKILLIDDDVPMDTKSVCGILLLTMFILKCGPNGWCEFLKPTESSQVFNDLLATDSGRLSMLSAVATVVAPAVLSCTLICDQTSIILLTDGVVAIGEKTSSDSSFTLAVTRTLVQISKMLKACTARIGLKLVDSLLVFVWAHLEHHMDSVRHLAAQLLTNIVAYCTRLKTRGEHLALDNLFSALTSLNRSRKSYYVSLTSLTAELGATRVLKKVPDAICDLIAALDTQAVQASATTALESLLHKHSRESTTEVVYESWVRPILAHVTNRDLDCAVLNILENLLLQAVSLDEHLMDYLLPYVRELPTTRENGHDDIKCVLMLLSVVRKSKAGAKTEEKEGEWKGLISYELLKMAAVDAVDETRILALSLIVESPKSTEAFTAQELDLVLWYLTYNINAQAPNFRQLTLSMMKKFMKRLEDSYKVRKRRTTCDDDKNDCYLTFLDSLREFCYECLMPGANYSRRYVALQLLAWCEGAAFEGYQRKWKADYVDNLLQCLEDSYESNKAFALDILQACPQHLLESERISSGLDVESVLSQASSMKPPDCVSAAYKLRLLVARFPDLLLEGCDREVPEVVRHAALRRALHTLRLEVRACEHSVLRAARNAHMYGILHCMLHLLQHVDTRAISESRPWSVLVHEIMQTCFEVNAAVACVVNNSSPEGHLPMDMSEAVVDDTNYSESVELDAGRPVTAQMVLLCAWRSVKEVSLVLGCISSRMSIAGEDRLHGTLSQEQLESMGAHFTKLLAETKHRGAFEQAYVGFTQLLSRLWKCRNPSLHELPRHWLQELMASLAREEGGGSLCATRRSAGLPFMIQALVTTELQVSDKPKCFHECVRTLMRLCGRGGAGNGPVLRAHCSNVLRALVRCSALQQPVAPYVADALLLALKGFDGTTWEERNSSTLLLSALVVRVFGVARARASLGLHDRNRMTGRTFFLRHPQLYDFMLEKLKEVKESEESQLGKPSMFPILLLLARLYPSALEGTVSNLKLSSFVGPVVSCARSAVLKTRQLAARALVPLISPAMYIPHIEDMLTLICDVKIKRNFCHGILMQVTKLLENRPENLTVDEAAAERVRDLVHRSVWLAHQAAGPAPCYLLLDQYTQIINLIVWNFPSLIDTATISKIIMHLDAMLVKNKTNVALLPGRDVSLSHAAGLYYVLATRYGPVEDLLHLIYRFLSHMSYEVKLVTLNYLLLLHNELDIEDRFQEHLALLSTDKNIMHELRKNDMYCKTLYKILRTVKYLECKYKALKLLSLEENAFKYMTEVQETEEVADDVIVAQLTRRVAAQHARQAHVYLYALTTFLTDKLKAPRVNGNLILEAVRSILECSSSRNSCSTRSVVANFLEKNFKSLIDLQLNDLNEKDQFEVEASLWACLVLILEDDEERIRRAGARTVAEYDGAGAAVGGLAAERLRAHVARRPHGRALLCVLALLDFNCEVCLPDYSLDECRVFDQNEKYNVFLEETVWSVACAKEMKKEKCSDDLCGDVVQLTQQPRYLHTFRRLCGAHLDEFLRLARGDCDTTHIPKLELFLRSLRS